MTGVFIFCHPFSLHSRSGRSAGAYPSCLGARQGYAPPTSQHFITGPHTTICSRLWTVAGSRCHSHPERSHALQTQRKTRKLQADSPPAREWNPPFCCRGGDAAKYPSIFSHLSSIKQCFPNQAG